jgi:hypothetical protein
MKEDTIKKVLDSEFKDGDGRTFREFLADCIIQLFVDTDHFSGNKAASDSDWYHVACECLLPLDDKIGHYEDYDETEQEFVIDDYKAADQALVKVINQTFGTKRTVYR